MNLTLSVDEAVLRKARKQAESMGISLNKMVRDYLDTMGDPTPAKEIANRFKELSLRSGGDSRGWTFNRDEIYKR